VTRILSADARTHPLRPDRPGTALAELAALPGLGGVEVGLWEMAPGQDRDTEADEVFVVLAGAGSVAFEDGASVTLGPGVVVRLRAGERTVWTVTETLRKLYVASS
jgi:uncharacterized protein